MFSIQTTFLFLLFWVKLQSSNQCWNGYSSGSSWDSYSQSYNYPYGSGYDYSSNAPTIYISTYPQTGGYDYYQQPSYYSNPNDYQQPIVIVVNDNDDDLCEVLSLVSALNHKPDNEPIYIPYPIPICCESSSCNNCGHSSDCGCSDCGCGCKKNRCGCSNTGCCDSCRNCECGECKKRRSKSKCGSKSGCGCSNSECGCNKCIKHKSDRCCRG